MSDAAGAEDTVPDGARVGGGAATSRPRDPEASAGPGAPGSDFIVKRIDLNDALIRHPQATVVMPAAAMCCWWTAR